MSENMETMISSECKAEAEELANILAKMSDGKKERLEIFLEALRFWERWGKSA